MLKARVKALAFCKKCRKKENKKILFLLTKTILCYKIKARKFPRGELL